MKVGLNVARSAIVFLLLSSQAMADSDFPLNVVGHWKAYSLTARAITGDVKLSASTITFENGKKLKLLYLGASKGVSLATNDPVALIFKISIPKDVRLLGGNTLCGHHILPTYLTVSVRGASAYDLMMMGEQENGAIKELYLTAISGRERPNAKDDHLRLCASYFFIRHS